MFNTFHFPDWQFPKKKKKFSPSLQLNRKCGPGSCGYSGFHTSRCPIAGWAHTPIIVVRSRINSSEDVWGGAMGQSHSSHKQSSQSLLITPGMCVTSSTGFHRLPHLHFILWSPSASFSPPLPLILYSVSLLSLIACLVFSLMVHLTVLVCVCVLHTSWLNLPDSPVVAILINCCYVPRLTYLFVTLACCKVSTSLCSLFCL